MHAYYTTLANLSDQELLAVIDCHQFSSRKDVEELLKDNPPIPLKVMSLIHGQRTGGPISFETLFPNDEQIKALLAHVTSAESPFSYEEYEQQTVPLSQSLRELTEAAPEGGATIFQNALQMKDNSSLSYLLSWGVGSPDQILTTLANPTVPLKHLHLFAKKFTDEQAMSLGQPLQQRTALLSLSLTTDYLKEGNKPTLSEAGAASILEGLQNLPFLTSLIINGY